MKTFSALAAAATIAAAVTISPGASEPVSANSPLNSGKSDRLDVHAAAPQCALQAWPYYEPGCIKDRKRTASQTKPVRVVTADRVR